MLHMDPQFSEIDYNNNNYNNNYNNNIENDIENDIENVVENDLQNKENNQQNDELENFQNLHGSFNSITQIILYFLLWMCSFFKFKNKRN
jgi:hypothetical protein